MGDFARTAIRAQPLDYARIVARDVMVNFTVPRVDRYEYDTAAKWRFETYLDFEQTGWTRPAYLAHGGTLLEHRQPFAGWLGWYGWTVYAWGPLLFLLTLLSLVGLVLPRRDPDRLRPLLALTLLFAVGLLDGTGGDGAVRLALPAAVRGADPGGGGAGRHADLERSRGRADQRGPGARQDRGGTGACRRVAPGANRPDVSRIA